MDKIKFFLEIKLYFFSTFRKFTVGGFVNQQIKKLWPYHCVECSKLQKVHTFRKTKHFSVKL